MSCITWSSNLSVDNAFIDKDHQHLIELINALHKAIVFEHSRSMCSRLFQQLIDATSRHFQREEQYMRAIGYADYDFHRLDHERLLGDLSAMQNKFEAGNTVLSIKVSLFLRDWLLGHIATEDKRLANAVKLSPEVHPLAKAAAEV